MTMYSVLAPNNAFPGDASRGLLKTETGQTFTTPHYKTAQITATAAGGTVQPLAYDPANGTHKDIRYA